MPAKQKSSAAISINPLFAAIKDLSIAFKIFSDHDNTGSVYQLTKPIQEI